MYPTVEVRWFFQGEVPTAVLEWFTAVDDGLVQEPARTDYYLRPLFGDGMGIKLREGHIEIKQRMKTMQTIQFRKQVEGVIEQWQKWSFLLSEETRFSAIIEASEWIAVEKIRCIQSYRPELLKKIQARFPGLSMEADCRIELTDLVIQDERWWTLGFESSGDDETAVSTKLIPAIEWALSSNDVCTLDKRDSFGYPRLLLPLLMS